MPTITLASARTRVTVVPEYGGRIAQMAVRPAEAWLPLLIDPPAGPADAPHSWGSFVMAPWPNRIARGRFSFDGRAVQLPVNDEGHALHGLTADVAWEVEDTDEASCTLTLDFDARWPFGGRAVQRIAVLDDGLTQVVELHATGAPYPAGCGWHPWFRRAIGGKSARVLVDADARLELDAQIPTGKLLGVAGNCDLRRYPPLGDRRVDDCYAGVRDLRIAWGELELALTSPAVYAQVYTPAHAVCIEPQTCAPNAFNMDAHGAAGRTHSSWGGRVVVAQGAPLVAATTWRWGFA